MKQLKILNLIWLLIKILCIKGNDFIFYHCCHEGSEDCPLEVEGIEIRKTLVGDKITIY